MNKRLVDCVIICLGIFLIEIVVFHEYVLKNHIFLFSGILSDLVRINLPTYYLIYDNLYNGVCLWSWEMGIGTSLLTHADAIFDPFTYILFVNGRESIPSMMIYYFMSKIMIEGIACYFYLNKFSFSRWNIIISSIAYSFCGYSLIMGGNFSLGTILVYFPIMLLGIDNLIKDGKIKLCIVIFILITVYSFYYMYISIILGGLYLVYRCIYKFNKMQYLFQNMVIYGILWFISIGLCAFILVPEWFLVKSLPRVGSDLYGFMDLTKPNIDVLITSYAKCFGNDIWGTAILNNYMGVPGDYFELGLYTFSLTIPLMLIAWKYFSEKQKEMIKFAICFFAICLLMPLCSYIFNGFSTINYRWTYVINLFLTVLLCISVDKIIENIENISIKGVCLGSVPIIIVTLITVLYNDMYVNEYIYYLSYEFITLILLVYITKNYINHKKIIFYGGLFCLIGVDVVVNYFVWYNSDSEMYDHVNMDIPYNDTSYEIIKKIQQDDDGLYRIYKNFDSVYDNNKIPSNNDAMAQSYYGVKSYNSMNNASYINFLQSINEYVCNPLNTKYYIENSIKPSNIKGQDLNYINGVSDKGILNILGVKYFIVRENDIWNADDISCIEEYSTKDLKVYKNNMDTSIAFFSNNYGTSDYMSIYKLINDKYVLNNVRQSENDQIKTYNLVVEKKADTIFTKVDIDKSGYVVFSIPYDKGWSAIVNNQEVNLEKVNYGLTGVFLEPGTYSIELSYSPYGMYAGMGISCAVLLIIILAGLKNIKIFDVVSQIVIYKYPLSVKKINICTIFMLAFVVICMLGMGIKLKNIYISHKEKNTLYTNKDVGGGAISSYSIKKDVFDIDYNNSTGKRNEPMRVIVTQTLNIPGDCDLGLEYVHYYDNHNITIEIVGRDKLCHPKIWLCQYTEDKGWGEFVALDDTREN